MRAALAQLLVTVVCALIVGALAYKLVEHVSLLLNGALA